MNLKEEPCSVHTSYYSRGEEGWERVRDKALIKLDPQSLIILTASAAGLINGLDVADTDPLSVPRLTHIRPLGFSRLTHILSLSPNGDSCVGKKNPTKYDRVFLL